LEQPKKPGPRDITDLKARLGLNKGAAAPAAPPPAAPRGGFPGPAAQPPAPTGAQQFYNPAPPPGAPPPGMHGHGMAPGQPAPMHHDPFAAMRPPAGQTFDLRPVEDLQPVAKVNRGGLVGLLMIAGIVLVVGAVIGYFSGITMGARHAWNATNRGAKVVAKQLQEMQKTVTQIDTAVGQSMQRAASEKRDRLGYDPRIIEELEKVKLDPRPDTSEIFRVDYMRLENLAVDNLMAYYYDTIALYTEVDGHVKRTKADKDSLAAFAAKQGEKSQANYGVVFAGGGKMVIANLVEVGAPVCKGGGTDCAADQLEGFQIRGNSGGSWSTRKVAAKPEGNIVVPLDRTPLLESVMAGSPDQARMEQYRQRYAKILLLLARLKQTQKPLVESINKAAARPDMFTL
jgi:hypothetical protein